MARRRTLMANIGGIAAENRFAVGIAYLGFYTDGGWSAWGFAERSRQFVGFFVRAFPRLLAIEPAMTRRRALTANTRYAPRVPKNPFAMGISPLNSRACPVFTGGGKESRRMVGEGEFNTGGQRRYVHPHESAATVPARSGARVCCRGCGCGVDPVPPASAPHRRADIGPVADRRGM